MSLPLPPVVSPLPNYTCFSYTEEEGSIAVIRVLIERMSSTDVHLYQKFLGQARSIRKALRQEKFILDFSAVEEFTTDAFKLIDFMRIKMENVGRKVVLCRLNPELQTKFTIGLLLPNFSVYEDVEAARAALRI